MEPIGDFEYNKKDLIGHGAFAVVFKGRKRRKHDFVVAIKSITKKNLAKSQNLLSKEIKILKELSDLKHENVVTLFDCKETSHHVYLVMEYCNGGDLADYLQAKGTLSEDTISSFLIQIAGAMKALNAKGIVHRDLKPQNILLCHSGKHSPQPNDIKLKIADFGFARFLQDGVMAATLCGSPMYMAPEVIMSLQYDAKADLWSIGTIVFQCLTGKAPFQAQTPQQLKHFYEKNPNLMPNIPSGTSPELKDLLLKLLKRNAKDRVEFEEFFKHPFLKPVPVHPISAPVAVPKRKASFEEGSPKMKQVSSSPLSGDMPQSPPACNIQKLAEPPEPIDVSPPEVGGFMKIDKDEQSSGRSNSPSEDYVLVPEHIPSDMSGGESGGSTRSHKHPSSMDLFPESTPTSPKRKGVRVDTDNNTVIYNKKTSENAQQPLTPQQQTSPNRPSTLAVTTTPSSSPTPAASQPIPVPSQVKAYQLIQKSSSSPVSPMAPRASPTSSSSAASSQHSQRSQNVPIPRCKSSEGKVVACSAPTAGSMSPPTVQFTIGTPPAGTWMRRNSVSGTPPCGRQSATPPSNSSSPLRKSGTTPPPSAVPQLSGPSSLPTIAGSPTKIPSYTELAARRGSNPFSPSAPLQLPFGTIRNMTCPANMAAIGFGNEDQPTLQHAPSEPSNLLHRVSNGDRLSEDFLLRTAFGSQAVSPPPPTTIITGFPAQLAQSPTGNNVVVPYNSPNLAWSRDRSSSQSSLSSERKSSLNRRGSIAESPPNSLPYAQSPPYMEGPIMFVAPELAEETLMDPEHNETMAKLNFILALVDCIIELAQTRSTPITESVNRNQGESFTLDHISFISEGQRRMEQLVLYVRALQLLSSSLQLSRTEIKAGRLQPSNAVKNVLKELNHHYHQCLNQCKQLHGRGPLKIPGVNPQSVAITADKLIYSYAIEMCQVAALDELFGNPQECFKRYQNAQILLHSLVHQAQNVKDRLLLAKYKASVEKRLYNLQSQGYIYAYDSS